MEKMQHFVASEKRVAKEDHEGLLMLHIIRHNYVLGLATIYKTRIPGFVHQWRLIQTV